MSTNGIRTKRIWTDLMRVNPIATNNADIWKNLIHVSYTNGDTTSVNACMFGPSDTPYENGYYFFNIKFPDDYPFNPPKVKYLTTNGVRFNPNLYQNGKVCLSMINTWAGPGWLPSYTIDKVVIAIQALVMNEHPLVNEPGHENDANDILEAYNRAVLHQNYALGIIRMYQSLNSEPLGIFKDIIINKINENKEFYVNQLEKYIKEYKDIPEFRTQTYGMKIKNNYKGMLKFIKEI